MAVLERPAGADRPHVVASPPGTGGEASSIPDRVLMKGNEAIAEAAIAAGCDAYFGYPITPQAELLEWMARRMPEEGRVFVQAESELAAINMALGAAAAGARVLVSSSSPGISLMAEAMSYMAGSRLPCVLVNVMRGGPGPRQHRRRPGRLPPGDQGPRPRRLPRPGAGAVIHRRGDRARRRCLRPRRALPDAGDDPRGRHPGPGDGAGPAGLPDARPPDAGLEHRRRRGPRAPRRSGRSTCGPRTSSATTWTLQAIYAEITAREPRWAGEHLDDAEVVLVAYGTAARVARTAVERAREQGFKAGLFRPITLWPFPADRPPGGGGQRARGPGRGAVRGPARGGRPARA